jgi:hypothetical protein
MVKATLLIALLLMLGHGPRTVNAVVAPVRLIVKARMLVRIRRVVILARLALVMAMSRRRKLAIRWAARPTGGPSARARKESRVEVHKRIHWLVVIGSGASRTRR